MSFINQSAKLRKITYKYVHTHTYTRTHSRTHARTHNINPFIHTPMHTHTHTHTCKRTRTRTYTRAHARTDTGVQSIVFARSLKQKSRKTVSLHKLITHRPNEFPYLQSSPGIRRRPPEDCHTRPFCHPADQSPTFVVISSISSSTLITLTYYPQLNAASAHKKEK